MSSLKSDPRFQYAYARTPLYCLVDRGTTEITTTGFWLDLDGDLSAPECLPVGCTHGRDNWGSLVFRDFIPRGWSIEEETQQAILSKKLIDELIDELLNEGSIVPHADT